MKPLEIEKEQRLKRLRYRSWHRGCKETDLILGQFADARLHTLDTASLDLYERLLNEDDADLWDWLTGKTAPVSSDYAPLLTELMAHGRPLLTL